MQVFDDQNDKYEELADSNDVDDEFGDYEVICAQEM